MDLQGGNGGIAPHDGGDEVFFNFTAIPGQGYRTVAPGTRVVFDVVAGRAGLTSGNIRPAE